MATMHCAGDAVVAGAFVTVLVIGFMHASALRCKYTRVHHTEREVKERTKVFCHRYQQKH